MRCALVSVAVVILGTAGCASHNKQQGARGDGTVLSLDPTEPQELSEWWGDGTHLLFLDPSGTYRRFDGTDRYREPAERGRWWQQSYATIWLEPYEKQGGRSTRVVVRKDGDHLALNVPGVGSMAPLAGPPMVIEDRLIGQWTGAGGELRLGQDLRYRLSPRSAAAGAAATLASQQGAWTLQENVVLLQPDSAGLAPTMLRIRGQEEETIVLESPQGVLERSPALPNSS